MGKFIDMTGQRFGRLIVQTRAANSSTHQAQWNCLCDCGNTTTVRANTLRMETTKSCGCWQKENGAIQGVVSRPKHGHSRSGTYISWRAMLSRCENKNSDQFPIYGARGISVCERWHQFEHFLADMGERPRGMTMDRKDPNGNYSLENCRWANAKTQSRNKRNNQLYDYKGQTRCIAEWAELLGLNLNALGRRLKNGWDVVSAIEQPVKRGVQCGGYKNA